MRSVRFQDTILGLAEDCFFFFFFFPLKGKRKLSARLLAQQKSAKEAHLGYADGVPSAIPTLWFERILEGQIHIFHPRLNTGVFWYTLFGLVSREGKETCLSCLSLLLFLEGGGGSPISRQARTNVLPLKFHGPRSVPRLQEGCHALVLISM